MLSGETRTAAHPRVLAARAYKRAGVRTTANTQLTPNYYHISRQGRISAVAPSQIWPFCWKMRHNWKRSRFGRKDVTAWIGAPTSGSLPVLDRRVSDGPEPRGPALPVQARCTEAGKAEGGGKDHSGGAGRRQVGGAEGGTTISRKLALAGSCIARPRVPSNAAGAKTEKQ